MRKPIIAGNWKMYKTTGEAKALADALCASLKNVKDVDVVLCPTFTSLQTVVSAVKGSPINVGAQNMSPEDSGAFTGEISADMLLDLGVSYVILGHSERREYFHESNVSVNKKTHKALAKNLTPIVCIGEKLQERESGITESVVREQLEGSLKDLTAKQMSRVVLAYEPVWAIGTGKTATPEQAQAVHAFIRKTVARLFDQHTADVVRIQYGGSVKPENIAELMKQADIDGALVGGASLQAESFAKIVQF